MKFGKRAAIAIAATLLAATAEKAAGAHKDVVSFMPLARPLLPDMISHCAAAMRG